MAINQLSASADSTPDNGELMPARINFGALTWLSRNLPLVQLLMKNLGHTWVSLRDAAEWLESHVPGNEHGELNPWMRGALWIHSGLQESITQILQDTGMFRGCTLRNGHHHEANVTGAKFQAMVKRLRPLVRRLLKGEITIDQFFYQIGHRPRTDWQDGTIEEITATIPPLLYRHPWVQAELSRPEPTAPESLNEEQRRKFGKWGGPFESESKLGLLALLIALVEAIQEAALNVELDFMPIRKDDDSDKLVPEVPTRDYMACKFTLPNGIEVIALNAPAIQRTKGMPRPTTDSSTNYRLRFFPPVPNASMVVISGPTHGYRVARMFETAVHAVRPDCEVHGMWEGANSHTEALFANALSELVRLVNKASLEADALNPA